MEFETEPDPINETAATKSLDDEHDFEMAFEVREELKPEKRFSLKSREDQIKDLNAIKRMSVQSLDMPFDVLSNKDDALLISSDLGFDDQGPSIEESSGISLQNNTIE